MRKAKRGRSKPLLVIITVLVLLLIIGALRLIRPGEKHADTADGLERLNAMEQADINSVREAVMAASGKFKYRTEDGELDSALIAEQDYRNRFADTVILGDSVSYALYEYDFLDSTSIVGKVGLGFYEAEDYLQTAVSLQPKNLILYLGYNDIASADGDGAEFRNAYESLIQSAMEALPDSAIYLHAIFPVREGDSYEPENEPFIPMGNAIISELADKYGLQYLDNTALANREAYDADGIHFFREWYPLWLDCLLEEVGL